MQRPLVKGSSVEKNICKITGLRVETNKTKVAGLPGKSCVKGGGRLNEIMVPAKLDLEWVKLIKEAKEAGLTVEEVKEFLYQEYKSKN